MEGKKSSGHKLKTIQLILLFSIPALLLIVFLLFAVFGEPIFIGGECRRRMKKLDSSEITRVIVSDPLFNTGIPTGSGYECMVDGREEIEKWKNECQKLFSNSRYAGHRTAEAGFWDLHIRFILNGEEIRIYFDETRFYFAKGNTALLYEPKDNGQYAALRDGLEGLVSEAFEKAGEGN